MKVFLLFIFFSFSYQSISKASPVIWGDVELNKRYALSQNIVFPEVAEFRKGYKLDVLDFIAGEGPVMYYQAHLVNCQKPELEAEMILINPGPEDTTRDRSIGVKLEKGCNLGLFLEPIDFYSSSIFEE